MNDDKKPCATTTNLLKIYETFYDQNKKNLFAAYSFCCRSLNLNSLNALNFVAVG